MKIRAFVYPNTYKNAHSLVCKYQKITKYLQIYKYIYCYNEIKNLYLQRKVEYLTI